MAGYVLVDLFGLCLAMVGFNMAFRQSAIRSFFRRAEPPRSDYGQDPLTYALRISGVMVMIFGITIGGMFTIIHFAS